MERWGTGKLAMGLHIVAGVAILIALYMALGFAPTEATMGDVQRIFYWHVATAWIGFFAFFVTLVASIAYLRTAARQWDVMAMASVEIGLTFAIVMTITGSLWAKSVWNTWWTWEPRLTTVAIMLLIYATYLLLRQVIDDPGRRARIAAVYGIAGFVSVPITFMATRWWRTIHPVIFESEGFNLTSEMLMALIFSIIAFSLLYFSLLVLRMRQEFLADEVADLKNQLEERG